MNMSVSKQVIDSLGGINDTVKPIEQSLKDHEMRPFEVEPNYLDDLYRAQNQHKSGHGMHQGQTKEDLQLGATNSNFLKKSVTEKNFVGQKSTIISASPFRAVLRRKYDIGEQVEEDNSSDDEREDQAEGDFDRAMMNDVSDISERFATGRPLPKDQEIRDTYRIQPEEPLTAPPKERYQTTDNRRMGKDDLNLSAASVTDDSVLMRV